MPVREVACRVGSSIIKTASPPQKVQFATRRENGDCDSVHYVVGDVERADFMMCLRLSKRRCGKNYHEIERASSFGLVIQISHTDQESNRSLFAMRIMRAMTANQIPCGDQTIAQFRDHLPMGRVGIKNSHQARNSKSQNYKYVSEFS